MGVINSHDIRVYFSNSSNYTKSGILHKDSKDDFLCNSLVYEIENDYLALSDNKCAKPATTPELVEWDESSVVIKEEPIMEPGIGDINSQNDLCVINYDSNTGNDIDLLSTNECLLRSEISIKEEQIQFHKDTEKEGNADVELNLFIADVRTEAINHSGNYSDDNMNHSNAIDIIGLKMHVIGAKPRKNRLLHNIIAIYRVKNVKRYLKV